MIKAIAAFCLATAALGCAAPDRTIQPADAALLDELAQYAAMRRLHHMKLAESREPGQRLIVLSRLVRAEDGEPIPHHRLLAYQADNEGSYDEETAGDDATARLSGVVRTDAMGRFMLSTILPGDYGSTAGNRHIHMTVPDAKPEAYDFYFKQYAGRGLASWVEESDQGVMLDLKMWQGSTVLAVADLPVKGYQAPVAAPGRRFAMVRCTSIEGRPTRRYSVSFRFDTIEWITPDQPIDPNEPRGLGFTLFQGADVQDGEDAVTRLTNFLRARRPPGSPEGSPYLFQEDRALYLTVVEGERDDDTVWTFEKPGGGTVSLHPTRNY